MNGDRQPMKAPNAHEELIRRIIASLLEVLEDDLPRTGDGGLQIYIDIAPTKKNDYSLRCTRKVR